MSSRLIGIATAVVLAIILFVIGQSTLTSTSTTGWSALNVTLAYIMPTMILISAIILAFRAVTGTKS